MNFELFIARRIHFGQKKGSQQVSKPAVKIAIAGVAIGLTVMILSVGIVVGFKQEVRNKLIGFGSHIQVGINLGEKSYEVKPMSIDAGLTKQIGGLTDVRHVQVFANQPGIMKTKDEFQGVVLKGVGPDFDWSFFQSNLKAGQVPRISNDSTSNQVVISQKIANMLKLKVGDKIPTYFIINGKVRVRALRVCGIYSTGFSDYDKMVVIGDIKHVQRLNGWDENQIGGLEILIKDYDDLDKASNEVFGAVGNKYDSKTGDSYNVRSIKEINPQIFNWLDMLDMNVVIILVLMALVAGFTIISGLLILILEKTKMIGLLKSMGAEDWSIRKIFLYQACFLVGKGMLLGNVIALAICAIQHYFGIIQLDPEVYYVSTVPISISFINWLLINAAAFCTALLMLVGPSYIITKVSPTETMRFE
jgi:lipoprotein-releasing system permease protein